jgi:hypothetical protein
MTFSILLYLIGAFIMACVCLFFICLGGKNPAFHELVLALVLVVFWPVVGIYLCLKVIFAWMLRSKT